MSAPDKRIAVLKVDGDNDDTALERALLGVAGIEFDACSCTRDDELIRMGRDCTAFIASSAPVNRVVLEALPSLKMVTSTGPALDHVDLKAAKELGVWICNVPETAAHEPEDRRRQAIINVLSWLTQGVPTNVVVIGR